MFSGNIQGVILQTYGAGNVSAKRKEFIDVLTSGLKRGIIIVVTSQVSVSSASQSFSELLFSFDSVSPELLIWVPMKQVLQSTMKNTSTKLMIYSTWLRQTIGDDRMHFCSGHDHRSCCDEAILSIEHGSYLWSSEFDMFTLDVRSDITIAQVRKLMVTNLRGEMSERKGKIHSSLWWEIVNRDSFRIHIFTDRLQFGNINNSRRLNSVNQSIKTSPYPWDSRTNIHRKKLFKRQIGKKEKKRRREEEE